VEARSLRFLIRPEVHCHNLASHLPGMILRTAPGDFENPYGLRPRLVEGFVDTSCFLGTCYRAANWVRVGHTQGLGRQDRHWEIAETVKENHPHETAATMVNTLVPHRERTIRRMKAQ
jgi:hypothetical protein